jgi:hypothetical protein
MVSPAMKYLQLEGCRDLKDADLAAAMQHLHQVTLQLYLANEYTQRVLKLA